MAFNCKSAFVFTGMSFLLVIPAIMLAASFAGMVRYGEAGREIALESDVVYYVSKDVRETILEITLKSGRWETHQATKLVIDTYVNLTRTTNKSYAKAHSFFPDTEVDPQGRNITTYLLDKIIETMNQGMNDTIDELERRSGKEIIFNDGNEITDELIINQTDPWGFYISLAEMPLRVTGGGGPAFNTTLPASDVYITFEGLEDPYITVMSEANAFSRVYRSPYEPYNGSYDENVSQAKLENLYTALIGSGTEDNPIPYYHYFGDSTRDDGISFFSRLEGNSTNRSYKIETFLIGNVLGNQSAATRVDHGYFSNTAGSEIEVCLRDFEDPLGNVFYIDDVHLSYYGLERNYNCDYPELEILQDYIEFNSTIQKIGDTINITATVRNEGNLDASNVKVRFFNGTPGSGGTEQIGSDQTITSITAGGSDIASVIWTATAETDEIYVRVDPDNAIAELDENNNQAFNYICVSSGLSVSIQSPQEGFSKDSCTNTNVTITASLQDTCSNTVAGSNASVIANISTGGTVTLNDPDEDGSYVGNWTPSINGSTDVIVTATGSAATLWEGLSGVDNVSGYVDDCIGCPRTRLFYDGFNDGSLNASAWETYQGTWSESSEILQQTNNGAAKEDPRKALVIDQSYSDGITIIAKVRVDTWKDDDANSRAGVGLRTTNSDDRDGYNLLFHQDYNTLQFYNDDKEWGPSVAYSWAEDSWYWFKFKAEGTGSATHVYGKVWADGSAEPNTWNIVSVWNGGLSRDPPTYIYPSLNGGSGKRVTVSFDDVQVCGAP
ncbi:MAG: CARDB domain-containing protein [Candidatus Hydrothermarchaeales archaeon]